MAMTIQYGDAAESVRDAVGFEYCLASSSGWTKHSVLRIEALMKGNVGAFLWAAIERGSLFGPELVQETTNKVVLIKEKLKSVDKRSQEPCLLELPQELIRVHNTFYVSNLKKCYSDEPLAVPLEGLHVDDKLCFVEEPIKIMDREVKRLKQIRIPIVKVRWNSRRGLEFT
ncbi:hypothetical protein Tco_1384545 [Tanacetum coccineum]